jgi:hypothetical protein
MNEHGLFSVAKSASASSGKSDANFVTVFAHYKGDQLIGSGFRNFLRKPGPEESFRFNGQPIDKVDQLALRTALAKLSFALERDYGSVDENPCIPSGYGYLMQLIAHDLVASASSLARIDNGRIALKNNRLAKLRLESIYGGGPEGTPLLYEPSLTKESTTPDAALTRLRLGPLDTKPEFSCPFRDLARVNLRKTVDEIDAAVNKPSAPSAAPPGLPDVVVGDPRNDDHAIISQLTVVFHLLHNGLVEKKTDGMPTRSRYTEAAYNRYFYARMAATLIFRNVIRNDVLKRFLHPEVYRFYNVDKPPFVDKFKDAVPLELTHGALRVCHSMLRPFGYQFNELNPFELSEVLSENSANRPTQMPLPEKWAAAWSFFFDIKGQPPPANMSLRLGPHYAPALQTPTLFPPIDDVKVGAAPKSGLAYRDMLSAALAGLWSVPALIKLLAEGPLAELVKAWPLTDHACRERALKEWMRKQCLPGLEMTAAELETLAKDPPLPFFLMFEALEDCQGTRFGLLGSIIVAEAIFGVLNQDPVTQCHALVPLDKALETLGREVFGGPRLPAYPKLDCMGDVIAFVADMHGLQNARPRFI